MSDTMLTGIERTDGDQSSRGAGINLGAFLPGGIAPGPQEVAVALIVLGALGFVILVRRGFASVLNK